MVRLMLIIGFLMVVARPMMAQSSKDVEFINYLVKKGDFTDAIHLCNQFTNFTSGPLLDSINFLKGWSYYSIKSLDTAAYFLNSVSPSSPLYFKSVFFSAYCNIFLRKYSIARQQLSAITTGDSAILGLKNFELAGMALLEHDVKSYENYSSQFNHHHFAYAAEEDKCKEYYFSLKSHRYKSPVLAGVLSGVLPGAGKIYAGRAAQGLSSMFISITLGAMAVENIRKAGIQSPQSLFFTGLFSVFYIGNIYGSVFSVKYVNNSYDQNLNGNILFDMHIPLRNFFR